MGVLPKDYKEPDTSNYMKFSQGDNTFRILSNVIVGMEYWKTTKEGRKPIRKRPDEDIQISDLEIDEKTGELDMPKHFWAMVVWNYNSERVQILEITQATIRKPLIALERNEKWGDLGEFDITVTKEGDGLETSYQVTPNPKELINEKIVKRYESMKIDLEALYRGDDPFAEIAKEQEKTTKKVKEILK